MATRTSRRRWGIAATATALAAAVLAGAVIAGQFRAADPEGLGADLATGEMTRVADIAAADGLPARGVFVQTTRGGQVCLWDALSATSLQRGGGCNPADDPLGGSQISASLAYDGGPAAEGIRDARIVGLAARDVAAVEIVMTDGTRRSVRLTGAKLGSMEVKAFGYRVRVLDLRKGVGPAAVVALDASGAETARQATGFAG
jgi:hypothetical protein